MSHVENIAGLATVLLMGMWTLGMTMLALYYSHRSSALERQLTKALENKIGQPRPWEQLEMFPTQKGEVSELYL